MINLNKISRKLLLLQRNELLSDTQKYFRKKFGRYIFTNFLIHYFQKKNLENLTENLSNLSNELKNNELVAEVIKFIEMDKKRPICTPFSK